MGFFKAYDMRGTFGTDFDLDMVYRVGLNLPKVVGAGRWLVGRDGRATSPSVRDALVTGLAAAGAEVTDIGQCTTPMVYYFTAVDGYDGSVMVTASHNPPTDNGLKVSKKTALPVGYRDGLGEVERRVLASEAKPDGAAESAAESAGDYLDRWVEFLLGRIDDETRRRIGELKIGIDCSGGMASLIARRIFPNAVIINDTVDGEFSCHSPNPLKSEAREQLSALVRERGLDLGIIFDGDADRAMFVDERGEFVQPDYLIPVIAKAMLDGVDGYADKVLHDVRTSRGSIEAIRSLGLEPVMVPVGHAFAKPIMRATSALCGGELAGHYYFGDFFGCDSGFLAALRVLKAFVVQTKSFSEMLAPISAKWANSGELNYRVEDKDAAISRILAKAETFAAVIGRSDMDGVRLEFAEGWINVRKSNTEPYLRLLIEMDTPERLADWRSALESAM